MKKNEDIFFMVSESKNMSFLPGVFVGQKINRVQLENEQMVTGNAPSPSTADDGFPKNKHY